MENSVSSKTALATSLMRSLHTRADPQPIINDPWGDKLVPASAIKALEQLAHSMTETTAGEGGGEQFVDTLLRASSAYTNVIARSCYTEDALRTAIAGGVKQYVLIGAGFDSYSLRRPAEAQDLNIFEIDHPATQSLKKQRLSECEIADDIFTHYLPADLGEEQLDTVLSRSSFNMTEPAFFSWLGVTMYLTKEANMSVLQAVGRCAAPGSQLVFSYVNQKMFEEVSTSDSDSFSELQKLVKTMGEPFISGFNPGSLKQELQAIGLELEEDLDDIQVVARFDPTGVNDLNPSDRSQIVRIRVP